MPVKAGQIVIGVVNSIFNGYLGVVMMAAFMTFYLALAGKEKEKAYRVYVPRESLTAFKYVPKETKQHKAERVSQYIRDVTGLQKGTAYAIADAFVRGRDVNRLSVPKGWPVEEGVITGPNGSMPVFALQSLQEGAGP